LKRAAAAILQVGVVLFAATALFLMLWEPHLEGRNANATPFEIYFNDPFLAFAYVASIPFFVGCYQAFRFLGLAGDDQLFSPRAVAAVRTVKHCAISMIGFAVIAEIIIFLTPSDDRAGGVVIGGVLGLAAIIVATSAAMIERALQRRVAT